MLRFGTYRASFRLPMESHRTRSCALPDSPRRTAPRPRGHASGRTFLFIAVTVFAAVAAIGCGYAGNPPSQSPPATPPPTTPPATVTVSVQPASANIFLGAALQFQATVAGASNKSVIWEVNSAVGGNAQTGTISPAGLYTAPAILPFPASVTVTAISAADATTSGSATLTITDNIVVSISPLEVTVPTGTAQVFSATLTTSGNPAPGIAWSVNGIAGGNAIIGTIVAGAAGTALYTAPSLPPAPPTVSVTATSIADSSKSASAGVTIACSAANSISPASASVSLGNSQVFSASFCAAAGATITWDVNGAVGGNATVGTIAPSSASAALYIAPADLPPANLVTVHATINAGAGAATTSSTVTVTSHVSVSVSPPAATLALAQRSSFAASVTGTPDAAVTWSVNGILNGNSIVGTVCVAASNPCMPPSAATATSVDYVAPASMPAVKSGYAFSHEPRRSITKRRFDHHYRGTNRPRFRNDFSAVRVPSAVKWHAKHAAIFRYSVRNQQTRASRGVCKAQSQARVAPEQRAAPSAQPGFTPRQPWLLPPTQFL